MKVLNHKIYNRVYHMYNKRFPSRDSFDKGAYRLTQIYRVLKFITSLIVSSEMKRTYTKGRGHMECKLQLTHEFPAHSYF